MGGPQAKRQRIECGWEDPEDPISCSESQATAAGVPSQELSQHRERAKCSSDAPVSSVLELTGFADGACRGNPGRASWGAVLWAQERRASGGPLWEGKGRLKGLKRTNNEVGLTPQGYAEQRRTDLCIGCS